MIVCYRGEKVVIKVNESYTQGYKIHFIKRALWTKVNEFLVKANKNLIQNQSVSKYQMVGSTIVN